MRAPAVSVLLALATGCVESHVALGDAAPLDAHVSMIPDGAPGDLASLRIIDLTPEQRVRFCEWWARATGWEPGDELFRPCPDGSPRRSIRVLSPEDCVRTRPDHTRPNCQRTVRDELDCVRLTGDRCQSLDEPDICQWDYPECAAPEVCEADPDVCRCADDDAGFFECYYVRRDAFP